MVWLTGKGILEVSEYHIGFHGDHHGFWLMEVKTISSLQKQGDHSILLVGRYARHLCTQIANSSAILSLLQSIVKLSYSTHPSDLTNPTNPTDLSIQQSNNANNANNANNVNNPCWIAIHRQQVIIQTNPCIIDRVLPLE